MSEKSRRFFAFLSLSLAVLTPLAVAQVTTTAVRGVVRDSSDAVIPNVALTLKDTSTGVEKTTVSGADGAFIFANMPSGTYSLTAVQPGFQKANYDKIVVDTGRTTDVAVQMKVGAATETVEVAGNATQLETSSNEVGKTIDNKSIVDVPLPGRDTLGFALLVPGVANAGNNDRNSTFNGLPNASFDITVDGMYNGSQRWKSGGTSFYQFGPTRLDAMEQVTISTTGMGADASGEGAMQIRMTTRRGTDQYHFRVGAQLTNEDLNANSYFNTLQHIARPKSRQNNEIGSFSGPLLPFIPSMKHKLFFFAYFEAQPQPGSRTNTTNLLTANSQAGNYTYIGTDGQQRTVNLLNAVAAAGCSTCRTALDPTVAGILTKINASQAKSLGYLNVSGQPYYTSMLWQYDTFTNQQYPSARLDYQIKPTMAWHGSWNLRHSAFDSAGPPYPGSGYDWNGRSTITTYVASNQLDWSITPKLLDNFTFGVQSNLEAFNPGGSVYQWGSQGDKIINLGPITNYIPGNVPENRNNPVFDVINNMTWLHGRHTFTMGGSMRHTTYYDRYWTYGRPLAYSLGVSSGDPIASIIQQSLPFVNVNTSDVGNANSIYAMLTGRLSGISGTRPVDEKTHQYQAFSPLFERYLFNTAGFYFQDSFRLNSSLTVNYGMRWQLDGPISTQNGIDAYPTADSFFGPSTGPFQPGVLNGNQNPVYGPVKNPYRSDLKNIAPNVGFAWNPGKSDGFLGALLGDRKTVIRGSFAINYYDEGMNSITFPLEANQGAYQNVTATAGTSTFPLGTMSLNGQLPPVNVNPPSFSFPMSMSYFALNGGNTVEYINPNLRSPYVQNWTLGIQRQLPGRILVEARYVGNQSTHIWHRQNVSELNIFENGFLKEFQNAQSNLAIANNISVSQLATASLTTRNFSNAGLPGQVALPIFQTAFGANGSNSALATGSGFGSSTFITNLQQGNVAGLAGTLASTSTPTYYCRLVGSNFGPCASQGYTSPSVYPINFFMPNPYATRLFYQDSNANTNYNALQLQMRKTLSHGLLVDFAYTWSHSLGNIFNTSDSESTSQWYTLRNGRLNYGPIPFDHRHTVTAFWTWDLPVGKSKLVNLKYTALDRVLGGWTIGGVEKIYSGSPTLLSGGRNTVNNLTGVGVNFGNGMTVNQLRDRLSTPVGNYDSSCTCFRSNVADIITSNGSVNNAYYAPGSTPGSFGTIAYLYGKTSFQFDMSLNKDFKITERMAVGINFQVFNVLNHPYLQLGNSSPTATTFGQITSTFGTTYGGGSPGARYAQIKGYLSW